MWTKIKNFFIKIMPTKRKVIQVYAALLHNANMMGFVTGEIFKGDSKIVCAPGLNCYSCPGAVGACPLGTIQNALYESKTKMPTYVLGIILLYCIILGRTVCGWLCPIGLVQELLYKIKTPKLQKNRVTRALSYFKYVLLVVLVVAIPLIYSGMNVPVPGFCKYICPAGTLGGAISLLIHPNNSGFFDFLGPIFTWKFLILVGFVVGSIFIYRIFCRFLCPLGAIYGIFNKLSILGIKVDKSKCDNCGVCVKNCKMDVKEVGDHECIMCGDCKDSCHVNAIHWKTIGKLVEKDLADCGFVAATELGDVKLNNSDVEKIEATALANATTLEENPVPAGEPVLENPTPADELIDEIINPKKKFKITLLHQRIFKGICYGLMAVLLVVTFVYANFLNKNTLQLNDFARDVIVELYDGEQYFSRTDDGASILYFYDEINKETINNLDSMASSEILKDSKLHVIAISSYQNKDSNKAIIDSMKFSDRILFGFDTDSSNVIKQFVEEPKYPYFIFTDMSDKIVIHSEKEINESSFNQVIIPTLSGKVIGNQVGNICLSTELDITGSDKVFNVSDNKGRVTVLNFWYTDCTPCVLELPHFNEVSKKYKDSVDVVAIHNGDLYDEETVLDFIADGYSDGNIIFASDKAGSPYHQSLGGGSAYPMTIIVNKDGIITYRKNGEVGHDELIREVEKALNS